MNKSLLLSAGIATALAVAGATVKQFAPLAVPTASERQATELKFIATMNQSLAWTSTGAANMQYAVYDLTPGADEYFSRLSQVESGKVADAGVYYDGYYYTVKVPSNGTQSNHSSIMRRYNVDTWQPEAVSSFGTGTDRKSVV